MAGTVWTFAQGGTEQSLRATFASMKTRYYEFGLLNGGCWIRQDGKVLAGDAVEKGGVSYVSSRSEGRSFRVDVAFA